MASKKSFDSLRKKLRSKIDRDIAQLYLITEVEQSYVLEDLKQISKHIDACIEGLELETRNEES